MRADGNHATASALGTRCIADKQIKHAVMESARLIARVRDAISAGRASAGIRAASADSASERRENGAEPLFRGISTAGIQSGATRDLNPPSRGSHLPSVNHKLFPSASHTRDPREGSR